MKYIRTKDGIYKMILVSPLGFVRIDKRDGTFPDIFEKDIVKQADNIEELCDEFVVRYGDGYHDLMQRLKWAEMEEYNARLVGNGGTIYGAIWTDKGLIYVAKMNDKGELELL